MMSEQTAYVLGSDDAEIARARRAGELYRGGDGGAAARRGDRRCDASTGPRHRPWPCGIHGGRPPRCRRLGARRRPSRAAARGRRAQTHSRRRREHRVRPRGRASVQCERPVRRDRGPPAALSPARPRGGPAPPTRRAAPGRHHRGGRIRHRRHARGAGSPARRGRAPLDRGGLPRGGGGSTHRHAGRAIAAPHGRCGCLDARDPGLLRTERSDRTAPLRERHALPGAADRGARHRGRGGAGTRNAAGADRGAGRRP